MATEEKETKEGGATVLTNDLDTVSFSEAGMTFTGVYVCEIENGYHFKNTENSVDGAFLIPKVGSIPVAISKVKEGDTLSIKHVGDGKFIIHKV